MKNLFFLLVFLSSCATAQDGRQHARETTAEATATALAQAQLDAYNARDIEAFLEPYAEDVRLYNFPNQLFAEGHAAMRNIYAGFFEQNPELHCQLVSRIVQGNTVIDQEKVHISEGREIEAIAIYKIREGKIQEVYFLRKE